MHNVCNAILLAFGYIDKSVPICAGSRRGPDVCTLPLLVHPEINCGVIARLLSKDVRALVGYTSADRTNSYTIPSSLSADILNITQQSNVNVPGQWIFRVTKGIYRLKTLISIVNFVLFVQNLH